jgi:hypothetical protein
MSWWLFRRRLEPLKPQTREHDRRIIDLDRELAEERGALRAQQHRLDRHVVELGEQFALVAQQVTERIVNPNGTRHSR